jgi:peptide/nickel transport system substrate-binding protein
MTVHPGKARWRSGGQRTRRLLAVVLVGALAPLALAACSNDSGSNNKDSSAKGGTLTIGLSAVPSSLNPAVDSGASGPGFYLYMPYATLVRKDPATGKPGPGLAESFGYVGEGNTTYELKLRPNLKFADGEPLNSEAVKTWMTYFPEGKGGYSSLLKIKSIETPDDQTVRINLADPSPAVTDALAQAWGMVISPKSVANPDSLGAGAPGAGPYMYDQKATVTGASASYALVPNKNFYDQHQIKWSKVVIKVIPDPAAMLRAVQSGQIDVAMGNITTLDAAKKANLDVTTANAGWDSVEILDNNGTKVKALGDVRVRQALNYAVDRDSIVHTLYGGAVEATSTPMTTPFAKDSQDQYAYDPEKAKQLLADAGYANGFSFDVVSNTATTGKLSEALAQNWADIGVKANIISAATDADFFQKFLTDSSFAIPFPPVSASTLPTSRYLPTSPLNPFKVDDTTLDDLYAKLLVAPPDDQEPLQLQIMKRITDQAYSVPVATNIFAFYADDKVAGVKAESWQTFSPIVLDWNPS